MKLTPETAGDKAQTSFPVEEALPGLKEVLSRNSICLLIAPPGAGKTTIVPPALLDAGWLAGQKIIMLEPRRIAARRAAEFMAKRLGEKCGMTVGYRVRMESVIGPRTRIEVVTEGILTRMLQSDAELPGTGVLIFDEYHERSIHADTGLAFALDVQKNLRPGLKILIMTATPDREKLLSFFGQIPVIESSGKMFPVSTHYFLHPSEKRLEVKTAEAVLRALKKDNGDILVFLPGKAEINRTHQLLADALHASDCAIHELHGSASPAEQDAAVNPHPGKRKIILATSIAETSLTIEGVRVVIDSGVSRVSDFDVRRGMPGLITVPVSLAAAEQRRGRAGRLQEGVCYRLWTKQDELSHPAHAEPEILTSDLAPLALELARWGTPRGEGLMFPDPPPPEMLSQAHSTLYMLGATDKNGRLTAFGEKMNKLPLHPRFSAMLLRSADYSLGNEACLLAAMLEENSRGAGRRGFDAQEQFDELVESRQGSARQNVSRVLDYAGRLRKMADIKDRAPGHTAIGFLLALAYPERVAGKNSDGRFRLAQGMVVSVPQENRLSGEDFLVITEVDAAGATGKAFSAAAITKEDITSLFSSLLVREDKVEWEGNAVRSKQKIKFGAVILQEKESAPADEQARQCILDALRSEGLSFLNFNEDTCRFIERSEWCRKFALHTLPEEHREWPTMTPDALLAAADVWLAPYLAGIRKRKDLEALDMKEVLRQMLSYTQANLLENVAPEKLRVPGGSEIMISYSQGEKPVLAVRLQELFGQVETPSVAGGRIPLLIHLLSPARRPLAVTQDLRSFWENTYPVILKQMRSKYPKHVWPDNPLTALPTNKTKRAQNR